MMPFTLTWHDFQRGGLHHHEDVGGGADHLVKLDDVRVTKQLQVLNLSPNLSDHIKILDLLST